MGQITGCRQTSVRRSARGTLAAVLVASFLLVAPPASSAAVTIGADLTVQPGPIAPVPQLVKSTVASPLIPGTQTQSPINGVIHTWRIGSADLGTPGVLRLRVLRGSLGVAGGPYVETAGGKIDSFAIGPQGLPIGIGDGIGVDNGSATRTGVWLFSAQTMGVALNIWDPFLADNELREPVTFPAPALIVLVAADVEPDADGDRFGDEARDSCPGQAGTLGGCPAPPVAAGPAASPPETEIVNPLARVVARKGGGSARFQFRSDEAGAKFECALRRKGKRSKREKRLGEPASCRSPKSYKRLAPGSYVFSVRAIGAAGPDPSPAKDPFRVVRD